MTDTTEQGYLDQYDPATYPIPLLTVDIAVFTLLNDRMQVLLTQREAFPCRQQWALPGGFVDLEKDKDLMATARRKLQEKTGLQGVYLEQVASMGNANRDPRGWSTTVVHLALVPPEAPASTINPDRLTWAPIEDLPPLAFDHRHLIELAFERLRSRTLYTSLPAFLLPNPFTLSQLQRAYEAVLGQPLTTKAFRTRMQASEAIEATEKYQTGAGRPARLFRHTKEPFIFKRSLENALPG